MKIKDRLTYQEANSEVDEVKEAMITVLLHKEDEKASEYIQLANDWIEKLVSSESTKRAEKVENGSWERAVVIAGLCFTILEVGIGVSIAFTVKEQGLGRSEIGMLLLMAVLLVQTGACFWYPGAKGREYVTLDSEMQTEFDEVIKTLRDWLAELTKEGEELPEDLELES